MLTDIILKWAVPFLLGGAVSIIGTLFARNKALKNGLQCLLRSEIIKCYEKYIQKNAIPIYAKEALEKEYKAYNKLGGNDVATELYHRLMELQSN